MVDVRAALAADVVKRSLTGADRVRYRARQGDVTKKPMERGTAARGGAR